MEHETVSIWNEVLPLAEKKREERKTAELEAERERQTRESNRTHLQQALHETLKEIDGKNGFTVEGTTIWWKGGSKVARGFRVMWTAGGSNVVYVLPCIEWDEFFPKSDKFPLHRSHVTVVDFRKELARVLADWMVHSPGTD